jgi:hypothetical protein
MSEQLYIAVIDREYRPSPVHCRLKSAWIDDLLAEPFVDAVELYSNVSFSNDDCGIVALAAPPPSADFPITHNPSCHIVRSMITAFLRRSDAGWLLFLSDGSFVRVGGVRALLARMATKDPAAQPRICGQCSEIRDYFQVFTKNSGAQLSRRAAELLNRTDATWDVACATQIDGHEALSHALDIHGLHALGNHNARFLGHPFVRRGDYDALAAKKWDTLRPCPRTYGYTRVCYMTVQRINELVVWGAEGKDVDKLTFVTNAKKMLDAVPDNVMFFYNVYEAELCLTRNATSR